MAILQNKLTAGIVEVDDVFAAKLEATGQYAAPAAGVGWPARQAGDRAFGYRNIPGYWPAAVPPAQQVTTPPPPVEPEPPAVEPDPPASGGETPAPEEPAPAPPPAPAPKRRDPKQRTGA
jgi:hypothetical protein